MHSIDYWLSLLGETQFHREFMDFWVTDIDAGDNLIGFATVHDIFGLYIAGNEL